MLIRTIDSYDQEQILPVVNEWWGGREMSHMLPRLFFHHFNETSFIIEKNEKMVGFLIGFLSQTNDNEAYIHFVGVHPDHRKQKIGQRLYQQFYDVVQKEGRNTVRCITSPQNTNSIAYHQKMGFEMCEGDKWIDGIAVTSNYDGDGQDRVQFMKHLSSI